MLTFTYKGPRRVENAFNEIMTENFLNLKEETARYRKQRPLKKTKPKTPTPRHTKIKVAKAKENSNGNPHMAIKEENLQSRVLYPAMLSFRIRDKVKNFSD